MMMTTNFARKLFNKDNKNSVLIIALLFALVLVAFFRSVQHRDPEESPFNRIIQPISERVSSEGSSLPSSEDDEEVDIRKEYPNKAEDFYVNEDGDLVSNFSSGKVVESVYSPRSDLTMSTANNNMSLLASRLPVYIEDYQTSVGIKTRIVIHRMPEDPSYALRVEIYNVKMYKDSGDPYQNSQALAFRDSFIHAKDKIRSLGVDPVGVYYIFGMRQYQQDIAVSWIKAFNLL
jgi:hypothetical protein